MAQFERNLDMFNKDFPGRKPSGSRRTPKTQPDRSAVARMKMINALNIEHRGCDCSDDGHAGDEAIVKATNASEAKKAFGRSGVIAGEGEQGHEGEKATKAVTALKAVKATKGDEGS
jgi:hypothetical protein